MKDLVKTILERGGDDETVTMPEWCDIVKISPNDFDGSVSFLKIADIKEDKSLEKVLKLSPWESIVIDEDIYVMIIDPEALNEKYNHERMINKLEYKGDKIYKCTSKNGYIEMLESIYNYKSKNKVQF